MRERINALEDQDALLALYAEIKAKTPEARSHDEKNFLSLDDPTLFQGTEFIIDTEGAIDGNHPCFAGYRPGHKCIYSQQHFEDFTGLMEIKWCITNTLDSLSASSDKFNDIFTKLNSIMTEDVIKIFNVLSNKGQFYHETCALIRMFPNTFNLYKQNSTPINGNMLFEGSQVSTEACKIATFIDAQDFFQAQEAKEADVEKLARFNNSKQGLPQSPLEGGDVFTDIDQIFTLRKLDVEDGLKFEKLKSLIEQFTAFARTEYQYTVKELQSLSKIIVTHIA